MRPTTGPPFPSTPDLKLPPPAVFGGSFPDKTEAHLDFQAPLDLAHLLECFLRVAR
jgi:hypothetical protein